VYQNGAKTEGRLVVNVCIPRMGLALRMELRAILSHLRLPGTLSEQLLDGSGIVA